MAKRKNPNPMPPSIAGQLGADGGGWNLIKRPVTPEDMERTERICRALMASRNPEDLKRLKNLTSMRATVRQQQAAVQEYMANISMHPAFMEKYIEWAIQNPGDHQKLLGQFLPKEAAVEVTNIQERILKVEYAKNWEETVKQVIIDAETE